jgi:chromosomal replication initiation ATPase DnaA
MTTVHPAGQLPFDYGHTPSHHEDDFIEGEGNTLALAHVRAFPAWPHPLTLIEGPPKAGKSHLSRIFTARADALVATPQSAERLAGEGGAQPVVVEDVERSGYAETALFHLLNQSMRDRRPVLMTTREPIANWPFETDDLKSRARLAQRFTLALSDDIQLSQMFVKLFSDRQVAVDPRIIAYLVARMERSPEEAVALAETADRMALSQGTAITRRIAALALAERGVAQLELDLEGDDDE